MGIWRWFLAHIRRAGEDSDALKAVAIKRVICTSEDSNALIHAATNLQAYKNREGLRDLLQDDEFHDRLRDLFHTAHRRRSDSITRTVETKAFGNSFLYVVLSAGSIPDLFSSEERISLEAQKPDQICSDHLLNLLNEDGKRTLGANDWEPCFRFPPRIPSNDISLWFFLSIRIPGGANPGEDIESESLDKWYIDKFLGVIELYRQAEDVDQMCQLISDAIATSGSDWQYRPAIEVYVTLLARGCTAVSNSGRYNCGTMFGSLGTLLISIEKMIRDPDTSSEDRGELREQRSQCFQIFEDEFIELGMTFPIRLYVSSFQALFCLY
ncbi:hypothetical protein FRC01_001705 [Tulasnella sp. 417]|nr:hypothetical protein FRC01_001705 [Tulasnella sp. 417]